MKPLSDNHLLFQLQTKQCHRISRGPFSEILDVRTPQETAGGYAEGAILIPIEELEARARELPHDGKPVVIYCAAGVRSAAACDYLSSKGHDGLHNLAGGFPAWTGSHAKS